jgi:hypothetical protein
MSNYSPIHFCYERDREGLGSTQCGDNELLRMIADRQGLERSNRDLGDSADVGARFTSNSHLVHRVSGFLLLITTNACGFSTLRSVLNETGIPAVGIVSQIYRNCRQFG